MQIKNILLASMILPIGLCSCSLLPKEEEPLPPPVIKQYDPAQYDTYTVTKGDIEKTVTISVSYVHAVTETLSFSVGGFTVTKINAAKGDAVKKGDALALLDTTDLDGPLKGINNQITANNSAIDNAKALYAIDKKIASLTNTVQQARSDYTARLNDLEANGQALELRRQMLEKKESERVITAGMDGIVSFAADVKPGDISVKGSNVFIIDGSGASVFAASDPDSMLSPGMAVDLTVTGGGDETYRAKVSDPASLGITEPKKNTAYIALEEPVTFPDSTYASIKLTAGERKGVLFVPSKSLNTVRDQKFVYILSDNARAVRYVTAGLDTGYYTEITSGLSEGDVIIV